MTTEHATPAVRKKVPSMLVQVPQIGTILVMNEILTEEETKVIKTEIDRKAMLHKSDPSQPEPGFFGAEAMLMKKSDGSPLFPKLTPETLDEGLAFQAATRSEAAIIDLMNIIKGGELDLPSWKKPHLGNSRVNPIIEKPTKVESATAATNMAELIVLYVNNKPEMAQELAHGVFAARDLAALTLQGNKIDILAESLAKGATANGVDSKIIGDYIQARTTEINTGLQGAQEKSQKYTGSWAKQINTEKKAEPNKEAGASHSVT